MRNKLNIFVNRIYDFVMRSYHYSPIYAFYDFIWWCCFYLRPFFAYNLSAYAIKKKTQWLDNYYNNKYQDIIERFKNSPVSVKKVIEFHIWFFWGQGEKQMPLLVRACYHQLLSLHGNVVLVTNDLLQMIICLSIYVCHP